MRLWNRTVPYNSGMPHDDDYVAMCVELSAEGMSASTHGLMVDYVAGRSLPRFLDALEHDFTGWDGVRTWESMDHELQIAARYLSLGHVRLTWTLQRHQASLTSWTVAMVTDLEAGEQLRRFVAAVHRFFRPNESAQWQ
ncbi:DUF6228 family protein [Nocardia colli]|uniref:DUF6228 family protein n=1 Tax=Nocardia colli TaxID=2545717 RepID=UPI0035E1FD8A